MSNTSSEPKVNWGLWVIMMCQCRFIHCNECATLVGAVDSWGRLCMCGSRGYMRTELSVLLLSFALNLKLLEKKACFWKIRCKKYFFFVKNKLKCSPFVLLWTFSFSVDPMVLSFCFPSPCSLEGFISSSLATLCGIKLWRVVNGDWSLWRLWMESAREKQSNSVVRVEALWVRNFNVDSSLCDPRGNAPRQWNGDENHQHQDEVPANQIQPLSQLCLPQDSRALCKSDRSFSTP